MFPYLWHPYLFFWESSDQKIVQSETWNNVCINLWGCGDTNGQVLTFDCAVLYPQLWISDSKRPHPGD